MPVKEWEPSPPPTAADLASHPKHRRAPDVIYRLLDKRGRLAAIHARWNRPPGGKDFSYWRNGAWSLDGLPQPALPLYRSETIGKMDQGRPLFLTEGEKAADALRDIGAQAVATVGKTQPVDAVLAALDGWPGPLVCWADNDPDGGGQRFMRKLEERLRARGLPRVLYYCGERLPPKGDAVEWLADLAERRDSLEPAAILETVEAIATSCTVPANLESTVPDCAPARALESPVAADQQDKVAAGPPALLLHGVSGEHFVSIEELQAAPMIGTPEECVLPSDGFILVYGSGGAGKTTLSIDVLAHLCSGTRWLNISIPRPVRALLIENEGSRGSFRAKLRRKAATWASGERPGEPFLHNVVVLDEPWGSFSLEVPSMRAQLAAMIDREGIDFLMVGPLVTIGAAGTGTPDEVNEFGQLLIDLRRQASRTFALWIVHHESKSGDISGAWDRLPETIIHTQARGHGRTHVHWRKARCCGSLHGVEWNLVWSEDGGGGFILEQPRERDYRGDVFKLFKPGEWLVQSDIVQRAHGKKERVLAALAALAEEGAIQAVQGVTGVLTKGGRQVPGNTWCYALEGTPLPAPVQREMSSPQLSE